MRLGVFGGRGRLGSAVVDIALKNPAVTSVVIKDQSKSLEDELSMEAFIDALDVCIDTSHAEGSLELCDAFLRYTLNRSCAHKKGLVIASTGHNVSVESLVGGFSQALPVLYAPNAALSIWSFLRAITQLAQSLGSTWDVHIYDHHHKDKKDVPSGTVLYFIEHLQRYCPWLKDHISFTSIRGGRGMILNGVVFSGEHETIEMRHQVLDRTVFARGLIEASIWTYAQNPGYYDIQNYIAYRDQKV